MHFPTTLPPTSGSPAAKLSLEGSRSSPHPDTFDGPLPPAPSNFPRTSLPLRPRPTVPPRPIGRAAKPTTSSQSAAAAAAAVTRVPYSSLATAKLKASKSVPAEKLLEARNSWKRKRKARLQGAVKSEPDILRRNPEYGGGGGDTGVGDSGKGGGGGSSLISAKSKNRLKKMFGIEPEEEDEGVPVEEFLQKKKKPVAVRGPEGGGGGGGGSLSSRSGADRSANLYDKMGLTGHMERYMASRASREEDKEDFDEQSLLHGLGSERRKLSAHAKKLTLSELQSRYDAYRERKSFEKEAEIVRVHTAPEELYKLNPHHKEHHNHKFTDAARRGMKSAKEEMNVYKYTRRKERDDSEEKAGARIVNAMRTAKSRFENRDEEREAKRQAASRPKPRAIQPGAWSRSYSAPHVPVFSSPSYTQPDQPYVEADNIQSPKALGPQLPAEPAERSRAYSQVFPARPSPMYRPTLSPVYSKSPRYTSPLVSGSSGERKKEEVAVSASTSTDMQNDMVTAHSFLDPPKSTSSTAPPIPERSEARLQGKPVDLSPLTSSTVKQERVLQSATEIASLRQTRSYSGHQRSLTADDEIPPLELPPPDAYVTTREIPPPGSRHFKAIPPPQNSPAGSRISPNPRGPHPDHHRRHHHHHHATHPTIDIAKTPTSSALEFWAAADASLHPSESASVQPASRRKGEPPPDIWRDADRSLNLRKGGPTMEEWIASLPGLGLHLGPWGDDAGLDTRVLEDLRTKSPQSSTMRGNEVLRAELVERIREMDEAELEVVGGEEEEEMEEEEEEEMAPEVVEELVPEDEGGSDDDEDDEEKGEVNVPPAVVDPALLHPKYVPSPSRGGGGGGGAALPMAKARMPRTAFKEIDLAGDVTERLEALERYWDEQGMMVGTVLKRMLWIVDSIIVKEREDAQRVVRRMEMGWGESDDDDEEEEEEEEEDEYEEGEEEYEEEEGEEEEEEEEGE